MPWVLGQSIAILVVASFLPGEPLGFPVNQGLAFFNLTQAARLRATVALSITSNDRLIISN